MLDDLASLRSALPFISIQDRFPTPSAAILSQLCLLQISLLFDGGDPDINCSPLFIIHDFFPAFTLSF